jgi:transcriptional regulator with XRE-family HTH domain
MKDIPDAAINHRIKLLRKSLKITQKEFAMVLAVSQSQIASMETGERGVSGRTIKQLCDSFDVNVHWLRTGEGDMFIHKKDFRFAKLQALFVNLEPRYQDFILSAVDQFLKMQEGEQKSPPYAGR